MSSVCACDVSSHVPTNAANSPTDISVTHSYRQPTAIGNHAHFGQLRIL